MGKHDPKPIRGVVEGLLEGLKKQKVFKDKVLAKAWAKAAGKRAGKHTRINSLRAGRLIIEVDESSWMYQLTLKKQDILKNLKKLLNDVKVDEIQFRIGNFS